MNIGEQIKTLRKQYKMSGETLGNLVRLSQQQISAIENGASNITVDKLEKICEVFNIQPSYFWESSAIALTPELKELLDNARQLPHDKIAILNNFIAQFALGHKPRYVKSSVDGEKIEYTYNEDERSAPTVEEEKEANELANKIAERARKDPEFKKLCEAEGFTFNFDDEEK